MSNKFLTALWMFLIDFVLIISVIVLDKQIIYELGLTGQSIGYLFLYLLFGILGLYFVIEQEVN